MERQPEVAYFSTLMKKVFIVYGDVLNEETQPEAQLPQDNVCELDVDMQRKVVEYLTVRSTKLMVHGYL